MKALSLWQKSILLLSLFVSITWLIYYVAIVPLVPIVSEYYFSQQSATYDAHKIGLYIHIVSSSVALAVGAVNLTLGLRMKVGKLHQALGQVYAVAVTVGAISGLYMAQFAFGGLVSTVGFTVLAIIWLITLYTSLYYIVIKQDYIHHSFWMILNFSLTFAAVTLRFQILPFAANDALFAVAYPIIAWSCWVPNLAVGYYAARKHSLSLVQK